ncbi:MAG: hydroxyacylglutathione hydrolase [Pseudomonadota bacterium]|nr:hydroxyacylglutathione hydrolase [Pseudomonadota bacterium]
MPIKIIQLKTLQDNYAYLLIEESSKQVAVIDPGSAKSVLKALTAETLTLTHILLTHHHYDHSGGVTELKKMYPEAQIIIHKDDAGRLTVTADRLLQEGKTIGFGSTSIKVLHLPCHTRGHVAFLVEDALFTGDTLFTAGCGKFFEGTATEMHENLKRLKALPESTKIYCGHEYTVENLEHAHQADPTNLMISERLQKARQLQENDNPLVPATLAHELTTNPFLMLDDNSLQQQLKTTNVLDTLIALYRIYYRETPSV